MTNQKSLTPRWPLTSHLLRPYVWLYPRIIVSKSHENTSKYVDTVTFFAKNLNQRSLTPRWPLTPHLLRSHVWLYLRIIVSKSHENTSKYVDTVTLFAKTWTKGDWPLDDLWPHICWGHKCDSTQGSLSPSPMGIHQCMWIQWSILQITKYILYTYYVHTTYRISDHIGSNRVCSISVVCSLSNCKKMNWKNFTRPCLVIPIPTGGRPETIA